MLPADIPIKEPNNCYIFVYVSVHVCEMDVRYYRKIKNTNYYCTHVLKNI